VRKEDTELLAKINAAIAKVIADGTYDTITAKYFASSIYGG
jgi:ABC-type amino acid transport substrate-binding protein